MNSLLLELVKEQIAKEKTIEEKNKKISDLLLNFQPIFLTLWRCPTLLQQERRTKLLKEIVERMEKGYETLSSQNEPQPAHPF